MKLFIIGLIVGWWLCSRWTSTRDITANGIPNDHRISIKGNRITEVKP